MEPDLHDERGCREEGGEGGRRFVELRLRDRDSGEERSAGFSRARESLEDAESEESSVLKSKARKESLGHAPGEQEEEEEEKVGGELTISLLSSASSLVRPFLR